jgi:hypothetical protein
VNFAPESTNQEEDLGILTILGHCNILCLLNRV